MAYTVFARKYRPQTFDELVGQAHVAKTLAGAIESGRVAHAFLFTGVRGVGKTTTARLLAKALCCEQGPTPNPCNECAPCKEITAGVDMDVQEIDGASNNGVADVRRLQESLPYRPTRDRFKIVIVDEVHMLSVSAFNAFLKTLEEPPEHVKFIFATTESHKVPVTIRSRCQRYDFRLIPQSVIAQSIRKLLAAEGVETDDAAVSIVAREAAGSMRDAYTLLDQLVAFSGEKLEGQVVAEQLGIAARESVFAIARALVEGDASATLLTLDRVMDSSADPLHFAQQLLTLLRDFVVLRMTGPKTELVDLVAEERESVLRLTRGREPLELQRVFAALAKLVDEIAHAASPRLVLEMGLTRIATRPTLRGVAELMGRLEALEQRLLDAAGPGPGSGPRGSGGASGGRGPGRGGGASRSGGGERRGQASASKQPAAEVRATSRKALPDARRTPESVRPVEGGPRPKEVMDVGRVDEESATLVSGGPTQSGESVGQDRQRSEQVPEKVPEYASSANVGTERSTESGMSQPRSGADSVDEQEVLGRVDGGPVDGPVDAGPWAPIPYDESPEPHQAPPEHTQPAAPASAGFVREVSEASTAGDKTGQATPDAKGGTPSGPPVRRAALQEWTELIEKLREGRPALAAVLEHGVPRAVSGERIVISFQRSSFYGRQADAPAAREAITEAAQARYGTTPPIEVRFDVDPEAPTGTVAAIEATRKEANDKKRRRDALEHPLVQEAIQVFPDASSKIRVRLATPKGPA